MVNKYKVAYKSKHGNLDIVTGRVYIVDNKICVRSTLKSNTNQLISFDNIVSINLIENIEHPRVNIFQKRPKITVNPEYYKAYNHEYYLKNKDKIIENVKNYRIKNREKVNEYYKNRRRKLKV